MSAADSDPELPPVVLSDYLLIGYLAASLASLLVGLPWWYRISRELRDLDRSYDTEAGSRPLGSLLMMTVGWLALLVPPFIAVYKTCRRIQRAQARAGQSATLRFPWALTAWLLIPLVLFPYMQHELNKVWAVESEPLDPWPADTSREATSAGTLPAAKGRTAA